MAPSKLSCHLVLVNARAKNKKITRSRALAPRESAMIAVQQFTALAGRAPVDMLIELECSREGASSIPLSSNHHEKEGRIRSAVVGGEGFSVSRTIASAELMIDLDEGCDPFEAEVALRLRNAAGPASDMVAICWDRV
jgi:hypothetical protein